MNVKKYASIRLIISILVFAAGLGLFVYGIKAEEANIFVLYFGIAILSVGAILITVYRTLLASTFTSVKLFDGSKIKLNDECINAKRLDNIFLGENLLVYFDGTLLRYFYRSLIEEIEDNGKFIVIKHRVKTLKGMFNKSADIENTKIANFKIKKKDINKDYVSEINSWLNSRTTAFKPDDLYENKEDNGGIKFMNNSSEKKTSLPMAIGIFLASILVIGLCGFAIYSKFNKEKSSPNTSTNTNVNTAVNNSGYTFEQYKSDLFDFTEENKYVEYLIEANDKVDQPVYIDIVDGEKENEYVLFVSNDGKQAYSSFIDVIDADGNTILESGVSLLKPNDYFYSNFESEVEPAEYVVDNEVYSISTFGDYQTDYDAYWSQTSDGKFCISIILSDSDLNYDTVVGIAKNYFSYNSIMGINGDKLYFVDSSLTYDDLIDVKNEALDTLYAEHAVYVAELNIDNKTISVYDKIYSDNTLIESIVVD